MRLNSSIAWVAALIAGAGLVHASSPHGSSALQATKKVVFHSEIQDDTSIRYVKNSGICETTPGVTQYSGYVDIGTNMSMWFWFFEARNSPETAPFTLWLNGGPGGPSMVGLFQENGPCKLNADGNSTSLNPYSWNNVSNMIYVDQPIGTGFSYGTMTVNSTETAAPYMWKAFQILFESQVLVKYQSRQAIFASQSYGGHYGPGFVTYFQQQNDRIRLGEIQGEPIVISGMAINNGWYDPLIQFSSYYNFSKNAPGYGPLQPDDVLENMYAGLYNPGGCVAQVQDCYAAGNSAESDNICFGALKDCNDNVVELAKQNQNFNDLLNSSVLLPSKYLSQYLNNPNIQRQIGADSVYGPSVAVADMFAETGDDARTWLPELSKLVNSQLNILIWAGDTDINCNWLGAYACVLAMDWYGNETLHDTPLSNMTLNGTPIAAVANVNNFSFAVFGAGHKLSAYKPAAALAIFTQFINNEFLHSV